MPEGVTVSATLLADVKNYLDITWQDDDTDKKLTGIIARGMVYINETAGGEMNFDAEDKPRELLFDYARYARSNALDKFQENYLQELLSLQIREGVRAYAAEQAAIV
jgi:hypothetical protein